MDNWPRSSKPAELAEWPSCVPRCGNFAVGTSYVCGATGLGDAQPYAIDPDAALKAATCMTHAQSRRATQRRCSCLSR